MFNNKFEVDVNTCPFNNIVVGVFSGFIVCPVIWVFDKLKNITELALLVFVYQEFKTLKG